MVIQVTIRQRRPTFFNPDPAIVSLQEHVAWAFQMAPLVEARVLEWTVYFDDASPFGRSDRSRRFHLRTTTHEGGDHVGILNAGPVKEPGDYKYGVRVRLAATGQTLSDDDPRLIVRP